MMLTLCGCGLGLEPVAGPTDSGLADEITQGDFPWAGDGGATGTTEGDGGSGGGGDAGSGGGDGGGSSGDGGGSGGDGGGSGGDGGSGGGPQAPTLSNLSITEGTSRIDVAFQATDDDGDLEGGALKLTHDGITSTYDVPDEISDWRPSGTSSQYLDIDNCQRGSRLVYDVQIFDSLGHGSTSQSDSVTLSGDGVELSEVGDAVTDLDNVGSVARDSWLCGAIWGTGNDGTSSYTADVDITQFRPDSSGSTSFALTWDAASADYDLFLYTSSWTLVMASAEFGTTQPERFTASLSSGTTYYLVVGGWSGPAGDYTVSVQ